jgi:hypothetical protein
MSLKWEDLGEGEHLSNDLELSHKRRKLRP